MVIGPRGTAGVYMASALLCPLALLASASPAFVVLLLPYTAGPLAFASLAFALDARVRSAQPPDVVIAVLWGLCAVSLSVNLSAPPLSFGGLI
jgi:hypothetical protein